MKNQTQNLQTCNENATCTMNTDEMTSMEQWYNIIFREKMDNLYNKNTTWTTNERKDNEK